MKNHGNYGRDRAGHSGDWRCQIRDTITFQIGEDFKHGKIDSAGNFRMGYLAHTPENFQRILILANISQQKVLLSFYGEQDFFHCFTAYNPLLHSPLFGSV